MTRDELVRRVVRLHNMVPAARLTDPRTSKRTARQVAGYSDTQAVKVLWALIGAEPYGTTADKLEDELDMRGAHQRLSDLKGHGLAYGTGETIQTRWHASAEVYRAHASIVHQVTGQVQGELL